MKKTERDIPFVIDKDLTASERKMDHIELAFNAQVEKSKLDSRFFYEPMMSAHPDELDTDTLGLEFLGKKMRFPIWVSSMTGGTELAKHINRNLARLCGEFGFGMGLGSCRSLLSSNDRLSDFDVSHLMEGQPFFANIGIAQLEQLFQNKETDRLIRVIDKLNADGLIIHVNPLQEWLQPEGDVIMKPPIYTIIQALDKFDFPLVVKEVGQGFGPESMEKLLKLPVAAIDFAANGGTNFAKLELLRGESTNHDTYHKLSFIGHSAGEMVQFCNDIVDKRTDILCNQIIISGGISSFLDGYYLINTSKLKAIYGQASAFLKHATDSYDILREYALSQIKGLLLAKSYLKVRKVK